MNIRTIVEPQYEPVSLAQAKDWLRVDAGDVSQDNVINMLIKASRLHAENLTGRVFIERVLELSLPDFPLAVIELPKPPCQSVVSVKYIDVDGVEQTLAADQYALHSDDEPAILTRAWEVIWPSVRAVENAVRVRYVAGYAPIGSPPMEEEYQAAIPENLKLWMQTRIASMYENREQFVTGTIVAALPRSYVDGLLDPLIIGNRAF